MLNQTAAIVVALLWLAVGSGAWRASAASAASTEALSDPTAVPAPDPVPPPLRLPRTLLPQANRATLVLDPTQDTFVGHITIEARVTTPMQLFWLHADRLTIDTATIRADGEQWALVVLPQATDVVGFRSAREIPAGPVLLHIAYRGRLQDTETKGVFHQREGSDWYVFTQFEPLGARWAYPCFDEPDSKVPWQITLEGPHSLVAISNTPVVPDTPTDHGTRVVTFRETPPLPSYLVAFAVGPFAVVDAGATRDGAPLRVIVPEGRSGDVDYVVEHTAPLLAWLEDYFGMPYPFAKLDLLAVPLTVGFGAMEPPGLITISQRLVVARRADFTLGFQRAFAAVTAHELAHQWFGDLVTLAWWDDL
jgi:alanyl aminopeptidase